MRESDGVHATGESKALETDQARQTVDLPPPVGEVAPGDEVPPTEAKTPREHAVEQWEVVVTQLVMQDVSPTLEQAQQVKQVFDMLDKDDQVEGIAGILNLLPDGQFPVLFAILDDKKESPDVLDAIFSEALNRSDEIKMPMMRKFRKDREHPLYFESARILDVVEPEGAQEE